MSFVSRPNRFLGGGPRGKQDFLFWMFLGSLGLMAVGLVYILQSGQGRETWLVVSGTLPFFILTAFLLIGGIGFWLKSDKFSGMELTLFAGITLPCSYITLAYAFLWFTAMGLAIVATVVAEHQAFIRVRDNIPRGSRFVIEIPVRRGDFQARIIGDSVGPSLGDKQS